MEFKYKSAPREIIDKNKHILEIFINFKDMTVAKIKIRVDVNARVRFNKFDGDAAKSMPKIKEIETIRSGLLLTL